MNCLSPVLRPDVPSKDTTACSKWSDRSVQFHSNGCSNCIQFDFIHCQVLFILPTFWLSIEKLKVLEEHKGNHTHKRLISTSFITSQPFYHDMADYQSIQSCRFWSRKHLWTLFEPQFEYNSTFLSTISHVDRKRCVFYNYPDFFCVSSLLCQISWAIPGYQYLVLH